MVAVVLLAVLAASCAQSDVGTPPPPRPPVARKAHVRHIGKDWTSTLRVRWRDWGSPNLLLAVVSEGDGAPRSVKGVQLGKTRSGATYALVLSTDECRSVSTLLAYFDLDGDGLPEGPGVRVARTRDVRPGAILMCPRSGTLYAIDDRHDAVLRYADTNFDGIPDDGAVSVSLRPGGILGQRLHPRGLRTARPHSVEIAQYTFRPRDPLRWHRLGDQSRDGVADAVTTSRDPPLVLRAGHRSRLTAVRPGPYSRPR